MAERSSFTLKVDIIACDGRGVCAELLPELITLDKWGYPVLRSGPIPKELLSAARWTVSNCPAMALSITADA